MLLRGKAWDSGIVYETCRLQRQEKFYRNRTEIVIITMLVCSAQVIEKEKNGRERANEMKVKEHKINVNVYLYLQVLSAVSLH